MDVLDRHSPYVISALNGFAGASREHFSIDSERAPAISSYVAIPSQDSVPTNSRSNLKDGSKAALSHVSQVLKASPSPIAGPSAGGAASIEEADKSPTRFRLPEQQIEPEVSSAPGYLVERNTPALCTVPDRNAPMDAAELMEDSLADVSVESVSRFSNNLQAEAAHHVGAPSSPTSSSASMQKSPAFLYQRSGEEHDAAHKTQQSWRSRPSDHEAGPSTIIPPTTLPSHRGISTRDYVVDEDTSISTTNDQDEWVELFKNSAQASNADSAPESIPTPSTNGQVDAAKRTTAALSIQRAWRASRNTTARSLSQSKSNGKEVSGQPIHEPQPSREAQREHSNDSTTKPTPPVLGFTTGPQSEGWEVISVFDGSKYYYHPQRHFFADSWPASLRREPAPLGWEVYFPSSGPVCYVNQTRPIMVKSLPLIQEEAESYDAEVAYWQFLASHPMGTLLPENAIKQAEDVLAWARTPIASRKIKPPFTHQEAGKLLTSLASAEGTLKIHIVAHILHHRAQSNAWHARSGYQFILWRISVALQYTRKKPILAFLFFILFVTKLRTCTWSDIESLGVYSSSPALMASAFICLIAAIILDLKLVAFQTTPRTDIAAQTATTLAIVLSVSSMASTILSFLRYKPGFL